MEGKDFTNKKQPAASKGHSISQHCVPSLGSLECIPVLSSRKLYLSPRKTNGYQQVHFSFLVLPYVIDYPGGQCKLSLVLLISLSPSAFMD